MIIKPTTCKASHLTATGKAVDAGAEICGVILAAGSAEATVTLKNSEDNSGSTLLVLAAPAKDSAVYSGAPIKFSAGCHATLTGSGATVTVFYY